VVKREGVQGGGWGAPQGSLKDVYKKTFCCLEGPILLPDLLIGPLAFTLEGGVICLSGEECAGVGGKNGGVEIGVVRALKRTGGFKTQSNCGEYIKRVILSRRKIWGRPAAHSLNARKQAGWPLKEVRGDARGHSISV